MSFIAPQTSTALAACQKHLKAKIVDRSFLGTQHIYAREQNNCVAEVSTKANIQTVINYDTSLTLFIQA